MKSFINSLEEGIISFFLAFMTLLVFVEVVLRFGFSTGLLWAQELTLLLGAWMVLFGVSYGLKIGSHLGVDALVRVLSSKVRRLVTIAAVLASLFYCGLFIRGSWVYLAKMYQVNIYMHDLPIPKWFAMCILPLGFIMMTVRLLQLLLQLLRGKADSFKMVDEAKESLQLAEEARKYAEAEGKNK